MIRSDEVATRIPDYRNVQLFECINDILAEAVLIREGVARVVDA
jgi:hypothetical protein